MLWAKAIGSSGQDFAFDIVNDSQNNPILTGTYNGPIEIDSQPFQGNDDGFIAKLSADTGRLIWFTTADKGSLEGGNEIVVDSRDNLLVAMNVRKGGIQRGYQSSKDERGLLVKYDSGGNMLFERWLQAEDRLRLRGITTDKQNNIILTGELGGKMITYPDCVNNQLIQSGRTDLDAFLANYDAAGKKQWCVLMGEGHDDYGRGIGADSEGNIYLGGVFTGSFFVNTGARLSSANDSADIFIARFTRDGKLCG